MRGDRIARAQDFVVGCMAPLVIDIRSAEDTRDVVHRAVQALAEGRLVALPTETVYGLAASALDEQAVRRLIAVKNRPEGQPLTLAVKSADDALDYVPDLSLLGRRLARRCWPGPVTLVCNDRHPDSLIGQLAPSVRQAVAPTGTVGLRVPAHQTVIDVLRMMAGPIALTSANRGRPGRRRDRRRSRQRAGRPGRSGHQRRPQPVGPGVDGGCRRAARLKGAPSRGRFRTDAQAAVQFDDSCWFVPATPAAVRWPRFFVARCSPSAWAASRRNLPIMASS